MEACCELSENQGHSFFTTKIASKGLLSNVSNFNLKSDIQISEPCVMIGMIIELYKVRQDFITKIKF
jgi:hypothetical protein